jgi:hypothetical protein
LDSSTIEIFFVPPTAEKLEELCKKKVKKHVNDQDVDKLFLPKYMLEDIKKMSKPDS